MIRRENPPKGYWWWMSLSSPALVRSEPASGGGTRYLLVPYGRLSGAGSGCFPSFDGGMAATRSYIGLLLPASHIVDFVLAHRSA